RRPRGACRRAGLSLGVPARGSAAAPAGAHGSSAAEPGRRGGGRRGRAAEMGKGCGKRGPAGGARGRGRQPRRQGADAAEVGEGPCSGEEPVSEDEPGAGDSEGGPVRRVRLALFEFAQNDPKADGGSAGGKSEGEGLEGIWQFIPDALTFQDRECLLANGLAGINASWNRMDELPWQRLRRQGQHRILPHLVAMAATLLIAGLDDDAAAIMRSFQWGEEFLKINLEALAAYACAPDAEGVRRREAELLSRRCDERAARKADADLGGNETAGSWSGATLEHMTCTEVLSPPPAFLPWQESHGTFASALPLSPAMPAALWKAGVARDCSARSVAFISFLAPPGAATPAEFGTPTAAPGAASAAAPVGPFAAGAAPVAAGDAAGAAAAGAAAAGAGRRRGASAAAGLWARALRSSSLASRQSSQAEGPRPLMIRPSAHCVISAGHMQSWTRGFLFYWFVVISRPGRLFSNADFYGFSGNGHYNNPQPIWEKWLPFEHLFYQAPSPALSDLPAAALFPRIFGADLPFRNPTQGVQDKGDWLVVGAFPKAPWSAPPESELEALLACGDPAIAARLQEAVRDARGCVAPAVAPAPKPLEQRLQSATAKRIHLQRQLDEAADALVAAEDHLALCRGWRDEAAVNLAESFENFAELEEEAQATLRRLCDEGLQITQGAQATFERNCQEHQQRIKRQIEEEAAKKRKRTVDRRPPLLLPPPQQQALRLAQGPPQRPPWRAERQTRRPDSALPTKRLLRRPLHLLLALLLAAARPAGSTLLPGGGPVSAAPPVPDGAEEAEAAAPSRPAAKAAPSGGMHAYLAANVEADAGEGLPFTGPLLRQDRRSDDARHGSKFKALSSRTEPSAAADLDGPDRRTGSPQPSQGPMRNSGYPIQVGEAKGEGVRPPEVRGPKAAGSRPPGGRAGAAAAAKPAAQPQPGRPQDKPLQLAKLQRTERGDLMEVELFGNRLLGQLAKAGAAMHAIADEEARLLQGCQARTRFAARFAADFEVQDTESGLRDLTPCIAEELDGEADPLFAAAAEPAPGTGGFSPPKSQSQGRGQLGKKHDVEVRAAGIAGLDALLAAPDGAALVRGSGISEPIELPEGREAAAAVGHAAGGGPGQPPRPADSSLPPPAAPLARRPRQVRQAPRDAEHVALYGDGNVKEIDAELCGGYAEAQASAADGGPLLATAAALAAVAAAGASSSRPSPMVRRPASAASPADALRRVAQRRAQVQPRRREARQGHGAEGQALVATPVPAQRLPAAAQPPPPAAGAGSQAAAPPSAAATRRLAAAAPREEAAEPRRSRPGLEGVRGAHGFADAAAARERGRAATGAAARAGRRLAGFAAACPSPLGRRLADGVRRGARTDGRSPGPPARGLAAQRRVDPDRPKRPTSAYLRFLSEFRSQKPADLSGKDLMKAAGAEWKALPAERKKPYEAAYEKEAVVYRSAYDQYVSSGKKDAFKRDPDKPKRPLTGFLRFVAEKREQNKDAKPTVLTKEASDSWKGMSEAQRKPYNEAYELDTARYAEKMKAYVATGKEEEWKAKVGIKTMSEKLEEKKAAKEAAALKRKAEAEKKKAAAQKKKDALKAKKAAAAEKKAAQKAAAADKKRAKAAALKAKAAETLAKKKKAQAAKAAKEKKVVSTGKAK
ncbi:unnamed protein product, partial [Prorocentrum cordatum]